jgi:hypothetical protein
VDRDQAKVFHRRWALGALPLAALMVLSAIFDGWRGLLATAEVLAILVVFPVVLGIAIRALQLRRGVTRLTAEAISVRP